MKKKITAPVIENKKIAEDIYDMTLDAPEIAEQAAAGQFVSLFCGDRSRLLPRPISLCGIDAEKGTIRLVYRVTGKQTGTAQIAERKAGDSIEVMGPLGNGFPLGLAAPIGKSVNDVTLAERIHHLVLPALTLSITGIANIILHTRQKLIDVMESDYVLFAKARGENLKQLVTRHGLRNIALPAITLQFAYFSELFGGSVLAENVFSYPGLGSSAVLAGLHADAPLLLGIALFSALFVFVGNLTANIIYGIIDPQIREGGGING